MQNNTPWEPPAGNRRSWRRAKPGGGYEYRDTAPTANDNAAHSEDQPTQRPAAQPDPTPAPAAPVAQPLTQQQLAASAATMPDNWPLGDATGEPQFEDNVDKETHARLMRNYEQVKATETGNSSWKADVAISIAHAFKAMATGQWDEEHSPGAGQAVIDNYGQTPENDELAARLDQFERDHFEETYFDAETAEERGEKSFEFLADGSGWFYDLSEDTQAAMMEDMVYTLTQAGTDRIAEAFAEGWDRDTHEDPIFKAAVQAAAHVTPPKTIPFNRVKSDQAFHLIDTDELDEDQLQAVQAYLRIAPKLGILTAPNQVFVDSSLAESFLEDVTGDSSFSFDDENDMHKLFNSLPAARQIGADAAPLSARNAGNVAGGGATGAGAIEDSWDSNDHDVYKRLSPTTYIVKRGEANEAGAAYEIVPAAKAPPLTRLPDAYWQGFDEERYGQDDDKVIKTKDKKTKMTKQGKLKPEIRMEHQRMKNLQQQHDAIVAQSHITQAIRDKDARMHDMADSLARYDSTDFIDETDYDGQEPPEEHVLATEELETILYDYPTPPEHVSDYDDYTIEDHEWSGRTRDDIADTDRESYLKYMTKHNDRFEKQLEDMGQKTYDEHSGVKSASATYRQQVAEYVQKAQAQVQNVKSLLGDKAMNLGDVETALHKMSLMASPRRKSRGTNAQ